MYPHIYKKLFVDLIMILPFALFLFFRLDAIFIDMSNSDATRWHRRSENFASALKSMNFADTYQSYHPGVTLMWLTSGVELGLKVHAKLTDTHMLSLENSDDYIKISGYAKFALVLVLFSLLLLAYKYIDILFDKSVALLFVFLVAVEPYLIGINRWYHLTSLEVNLTFVAFLALLLWAEGRQKAYLTKSAIFLGLAILTKFSTVIVLPVFLVVLFFTAIKDKVTPKKVFIQDTLKWLMLIALTIFILFPALWVNPVNVITKLISAGINAKSGDYESVQYAELQPAIFYVWALLFKLSPITLVLFGLSLFKWLVWKERVFSYSVVYIFFTLSILTLSEQKIERYILMIVLPMLLLCAVTLSRLGKPFITVAILAFAVFTFMIFRYSHPIYSSYYSPAFGGPKAAYEKGLYDDNGEYFAAAAYYLNKKTRDVHVYVPNKVEPFSYYFRAIIDDEVTPLTGFIVSSKDSSRQGQTYDTLCPIIETTFVNYNFEVVTIYNCNSTHGESFKPPALN